MKNIQTVYERYLSRKRQEFGDNFDPSDLVPAFIPHFNLGTRIEVDFGGEIKRGYVGVTTGWKPVFLLMLRRDSTGSPWVLRPTNKVLQVIPTQSRRR